MGLVSLAGKLEGLLARAKGSNIAQRLAANGGKELLYSSIPGAVITGGLTTISTGNPIAGLAVGLGDLGLSFGTSRAMSTYAPQIAGKYRNYVTPEQVAEAKKTGQAISTQALKQVYEPSMAQQTAMLAGSIVAPLTLEPMFMPQQQQQLTDLDQTVTQQQQLGQQEYLNQMYQPYTADGTMYQLQGLPYRSTY